MPTQVAIIKKNYAGTAHIFQLLTVVVLVAAGVYGYFQYQKLTEAQTALNDAQAQVTPLQTTADDSTSAFGDLKKQADTDTAEISNKIQGVYPSDQNYTALTKMLDDFFTANDKPDNRIFENSLSFSAPLIDAKNEYAVLPFTMSILTSRDNFEKFLRYVDSSGDLEGSVRLMDIKSISLSLPAVAPETAEGQAPESQAAESANDLIVSLSMNSYFQKPAAGAQAAATP